MQSPTQSSINNSAWFSNSFAPVQVWPRIKLLLQPARKWSDRLCVFLCVVLPGRKEGQIVMTDSGQTELFASKLGHFSNFTIHYALTKLAPISTQHNGNEGDRPTSQPASDDTDRLLIVQKEERAFLLASFLGSQPSYITLNTINAWSFWEAIRF